MLLLLLRRFRYLLLALTAVACVGLWPGVRAALRTDNSLAVWFLEDDPALQPYRAFQRQFGNDEVIVIVVQDRRPGGLLRPANLRRLRALSTELAALPTVENVFGPASDLGLSGLTAAAGPDSTAAGEAGETGRTDVAGGAGGVDSARLRAALARQPTLRAQLFTPNYSAARLLVTLRQLPDFDNRRGEVVAGVREVAGRHFAAGREVWLGGVGVVYAGLNELSQHDFGLFLGLGYVLMFVVFWLLYRDWALLAYALGTVGLSTYFTLGLYGALGYRLNLLTVLLPVIIILLGLMDVLHIINEVQQARAAPAAAPGSVPGVVPGAAPGPTPSPAPDRPALAMRALQHMLAPCAATMLTNVAGFLALLSSPMPILRSFGLFAGIGIAWCLVFTFGLGVWLLPLARPAATAVAPAGPPDLAAPPNLAAQSGAAVPTPRPAPSRSSWAGFDATRTTSAALGRLYGWVLRRRRPLGLLSLALTLGLLAGLPRLRADTYTLGYFPATHPVVRDHRAIVAAWGAYLPLELLVRPRAGLSLHSPEVQQATRRLADTLRHTVPGVSSVFGFQSLYQAGLESRFGPGRRSARALGSRSLLRLTHERLQTDFPTLLAQFEAADGRTGRLTITGPMLSARQLTAKTDSVRRLAAATLGAVATAEPAGYGPLYARIVDYVTTSQTQSLFYAMLVVLGLVWVVVRSLRLALLTVLPNLFPVLAVLGLMGWLGIALDTATASIAAIVLSLSVDDTLHFVLHYRRERRRLGPAAARLATITHVGPAIVLTGLILFCGYSFMLLGSLKTVQLFGLLTAISIVAAMFGELIIFPLVLAWFDGE